MTRRPEVTFRPVQWTGPTTPPDARRPRSTFRAAWRETLELLTLELERLDARNVVIEADFREQDLRADNLPKANARPPRFPGVRISFDSRHGPLMYATDTHASWQHNVRAIALSLQALRAVDRYGVTRSAEQYRGWRAITTGSDGVPLTRSVARDLLRTVVGESVAESASDKTLARKAALQTHPDSPSGNERQFALVQQAREVLGV